MGVETNQFISILTEANGITNPNLSSHYHPEELLSTSLSGYIPLNHRIFIVMRLVWELLLVLMLAPLRIMFRGAYALTVVQA